MSVIVKNMKMPQKCYECDFEYSIYHCPLVHEDTDEVRSTKRLDGCPLVELPEKHGKLIDANDLIDYCKHYANMLKDSSLATDKARRDELISVIGEIINMNAIIEAEGTEE